MLEVKNFNHGNLNILINVFNNFEKKENLIDIAKFNNLNLFALYGTCKFFRKKGIYDGTWDEEWSKEAIEKYYQHNGLKEYYDFIEKTIEDNKIKIFILLGDPGILHKSFLTKIKKRCYVAFWSFDDPINSEKIIKHIVSYYDYAFCVAPYYSKTEMTRDVFKSWGARKSAYIANGVFENKYKKVEKIKSENRDIDIIFIGSVFRARLLWLFKLKKHFGDKLLIYGGGWNGENSPFLKKILLKTLKFYYRVPKIDKVDEEEYINLLQRSKIGINDHMVEAGPSSARTFELPANGVMQICDNGFALKEFFELDKEVVDYEYKNAKEVIKKIEFFLENRKKREQIAKAGMKKTYKDYMMRHSFAKIIKYIKDDIRYKELNK